MIFSYQLVVGLFTVLTSFLLTGLVEVTHATHETDHRYTLYGTVTDANGQPREGVVVSTAIPSSGFQNQTVTDANGAYAILQHIHDAEHGTSIILTIDDQTFAHQANFSVGNLATERGFGIDFMAGSFVPRGVDVPPVDYHEEQSATTEIIQEVGPLSGRPWITWLLLGVVLIVPALWIGFNIVKGRKRV